MKDKPGITPVRDELQNLLKQQDKVEHGSHKEKNAGHKPAKPNLRKPKHTFSLQDELAQLSGDAHSAQRPTAAQTAASNETDVKPLHELIRESSRAKAPPAVTHHSAREPSVAQTESLQDLLTGNRPATSPAKPAELKAAANHPRSKEQEKTSTAPEIKPSARPSQSPTLHLQKWLTAGAMVCLVLLSIWVESRWNGAAETTVLDKLALSAERYNEQVGAYPAHLTDLPDFPENAIEMPIEYWEARSALGLTEIFWVSNQHGDVAIILRNHLDIWIHDFDGRTRKLAATTIRPLSEQPEIGALIGK